MQTSLAFLSLLAGANAFVPVAPMVSSGAVATSSATCAVQHVPMRMGLNPELAANFPRDFATVSVCVVSCFSFWSILRGHLSCCYVCAGWVAFHLTHEKKKRVVCVCAAGGVISCTYLLHVVRVVGSFFGNCVGASSGHVPM